MYLVWLIAQVVSCLLRVVVLMSVQFSKLLLCYVCLPNVYPIQVLICYLGSDFYHLLVLKAFLILVWVCFVHASLRGESDTNGSLYTKLKDFRLQVSHPWNFPDTLWLPGVLFPSPLARK